MWLWLSAQRTEERVGVDGSGVWLRKATEEGDAEHGSSGWDGDVRFVQHVMKRSRTRLGRAQIYGAAHVAVLCIVR